MDPPITSTTSVSKFYSPREDPDSSDCLDLSIKEVFVIVHFEDSDPGQEYEILSETKLIYTWDTLAAGTRVDVKYGNAKVHGTVVAVSDDFTYLTRFYVNIIEAHQLEYKKEGNLSNIQDPRVNYVQRHVIKVADKETQTFEVEDDKNIEYLHLKSQYKELEEDFDKFKSLMTEVTTDLASTLLKLDNLKLNPKSKTSSPSSSTHPPKSEAVLKSLENDSDYQTKEDFKRMIQIGRQGTKIPKNVYDMLNWNSYSAATRKLLITLFPRNILATHSLTGKPSPAFFNGDLRQRKMKLDPAIISDIVELISKRCKVTESLVRSAITTKCADENKMQKKRLQKKKGDAENDACNGMKTSGEN